MAELARVEERLAAGDDSRRRELRMLVSERRQRRQRLELAGGVDPAGDVRPRLAPPALHAKGDVLRPEQEAGDGDEELVAPRFEEGDEAAEAIDLFRGRLAFPLQRAEQRDVARRGEALALQAP
jgi:hypothetical protein